MKKYIKIVQDIKEKISSAYYIEGDRVPSISQAASGYHCSKGTVIRAYNQLLEEHILYVKQQSGFYVAKPVTFSASPENVYNLTTGNTYVNYFPLAEAQTSLVQALENYQFQTLNFDLQGVPSLLTAIEKHLYNRNIFSTRRQIFLSQGIHQAVVAICQLPFPEHSYVLIEDPSYSHTVQYLKKMHIPVKTIRRTKDGLPLDKLEALFKEGNIRFFYTIPRNHNPLGTNLSTKQIQTIAHLAEKYQVLILENDYFGEAQNHSQHQTIFENARENCIYLSSFTKLIPYLRIGYLIAPEAKLGQINQMVADYYSEGYFAPAMISQATLEIILKNNLLLRFTEYFEKELVAKKKAITRLTADWDEQIAWPVPSNAGFYSIICLHPLISIARLKQTLNKQAVLVSDTSQCFYDADHPYSHSIRISVSRIDADKLPYILKTIYETACDLYQRQTN